MNKKKYVMLYSNSGELISFHATYEKDIHKDQETSFISFTDLKGVRVEWNGLVLISDEPVTIKDKPEVINK